MSIKKYIGLTIGPISDTITEVTTPATLWFASTIFSDLTRRLCKNIKETFTDAQIYSPYYMETEIINDGIGKFHDRIFFSTEQFEEQQMNQILKEEKVATAKAIGVEENREFFYTYLQIHYVALEEDKIGNRNCVLVLSPYLDMLELVKTFPQNDIDNPIKKVLYGEKENKNKYVKESQLYKAVDSMSNQLKNQKNDRIYKIDEISSYKGQNPKEKKYSYYYAVVSADGDGMGTFLNGLSSQQVTQFSKGCLDYDEKASKMIGEFGGMTIYAGGDDLLFLAPVIGKDQETVWRLCNRIQAEFQKILREIPCFKENESIPTISFGISIQYNKFPLYEALSKASWLLNEAKVDGGNNKNPVKNNICMFLEKHSGQSTALLVGNESLEKIEKLLSLESVEGAIQSVLYHLVYFESLLLVKEEEIRRIGKTEEYYERYHEVWNNIFDNEEQKKYAKYIDTICRCYWDYVLEQKERIELPEFAKQSLERKNKSLQTLISVLQIKKFLEEERGEEGNEIFN